MRCENSFCIYWKENKCILEKITINPIGLCDACILVNIEENVLNQKRNELLELYDDT